MNRSCLTCWTCGRNHPRTHKTPVLQTFSTIAQDYAQSESIQHSRQSRSRQKSQRYVVSANSSAPRCVTPMHCALTASQPQVSSRTDHGAMTMNAPSTKSGSQHRYITLLHASSRPQGHGFRIQMIAKVDIVGAQLSFWAESSCLFRVSAIYRSIGLWGSVPTTTDSTALVDDATPLDRDSTDQ